MSLKAEKSDTEDKRKANPVLFGMIHRYGSIRKETDFGHSQKLSIMPKNPLHFKVNM